jgi:hypothetical protein
VPGSYANLPSLRFEGEDGHEDRRSFTYLRFDDPATVWVALDEEVDPDWLSRWRDTGTTLGTTDDTRAVYRTKVDAGTAVLGDSGDSRRMYTVFYRQR